MASFVETLNPCPWGFFDADADFQKEADSMVLYVKRKFGDDVLSVELTKKQIWAAFEESVMEYSRAVHEMKITSELVNVLGISTSSADLTNVYPHQTLNFLLRQAEPYASIAGVGGSYDAKLGFIDLKANVQDYDIYSTLKDATLTGSLVVDTIPTGSRGKLRVLEVFHFEPLAAQHFLLNASNITNFLATNFNYESYVNSTVFYVLPIFEDVLRRGMLEAAFRVRRSNYSYDIIGRNLRLYPAPTTDLETNRLYLRVAPVQNPLSASFQDDALGGVSGPHNVPLNNIPFTSIRQPGRQWIRQYTLALCKEMLGLIRSKFQTIPIPNADLQLNGETLLQHGREDKEKLKEQLVEWLSSLTNEKLMERQAASAEQMQKQLRFVPMPLGKAIVIG